MTVIRNLTYERLREVLSYNPCTGEFFWKVDKSGGGAKAGKLAGYKRGSGYVHICIDGALYISSRLAWLYIHKEWPNEIDHINRDNTNNSIWNLNNTDRKGNVHNSRAYINGDKSSKHRSAYQKARVKWIVNQLT